MQLTRRIPGHFRTNETAPTWLADVVLDVASPVWGFVTASVSFTADLVVEDASQEGYFAITDGADPRTIGTGAPGLAFVVQAGPFAGHVSVGSTVDVFETGDSGGTMLHLVASSSTDSFFVEISNVVITVRTP